MKITMQYPELLFARDLSFILSQRPYLKIGHELPKFSLPKNQQFNNENIKTKDHWKVGKYHETLWLSILHNQNWTSQVRSGVQVFDKNKNTLGEFDYLFFAESIYWHLEVSKKYYLLPKKLSGQKNYHWIGPNTNDRLDIKSEKISQQIMLYQKLQKLKLGAFNNIMNIEKSCGLLYVEFFKHISFFHDNNKMYWLSFSELKDYLKDKTWVVQEKPFWFSWHGFENRDAKLNELSKLSVKTKMVFVKNGNEVVKLLVVPNEWEENALSSIKTFCL